MLLFVFLVVLDLANGQELMTLGIGINKLDREDAFVISPEASFDFKNHAWRIGPALLISFGDQVEGRESVKISGLALGYDHFIHGKTEKWNMFHSFDFLVQRIKDELQSQYFDTNRQNFLENDIEQVDLSFFLSANAGVLLNLSDKLALTQTIGVGVNAVSRNTKSDLESFDDLFIDQLWSLRTSIRYRL